MISIWVCQNRVVDINDPGCDRVILVSGEPTRDFMRSLPPTLERIDILAASRMTLIRVLSSGFRFKTIVMWVHVHNKLGAQEINDILSGVQNNPAENILIQFRFDFFDDDEMSAMRNGYRNNRVKLDFVSNHYRFPVGSIYTGEDPGIYSGDVRSEIKTYERPILGEDFIVSSVTGEEEFEGRPGLKLVCSCNMEQEPVPCEEFVGRFSFDMKHFLLTDSKRVVYLDFNFIQIEESDISEFLKKTSTSVGFINGDTDHYLLNHKWAASAMVAFMGKPLQCYSGDKKRIRGSDMMGMLLEFLIGKQ